MRLLTTLLLASVLRSTALRVDSIFLDQVIDQSNATSETSEARLVGDCCCKSASSPDDSSCAAEAGHLHECVAFHRKPKCCRPMDKCEWYGLFSHTYHHFADSKLCTGNFNLGGKQQSKPKPSEGSGELLFFDEINKHPNGDKTKLSRDYTILVDKSGSMSTTQMITVPEIFDKKMGLGNDKRKRRMSLWKQAEAALMYLADAAINEDPDGISLVFFGSGVTSFEHVKSAREVKDIFWKYGPGGTTNLASALSDSLTPDTMGRAETVLVITDGTPDSSYEVEKTIASAAKRLCRDEDLVVTFVQVGSSSVAEKYLQSLDDDLQKKYNIFDIVDTMTPADMDGMSFLEMIEKGIND